MTFETLANLYFHIFWQNISIICDEINRNLCFSCFCFFVFFYVSMSYLFVVIVENEKSLNGLSLDLGAPRLKITFINKVLILNVFTKMM